MRIDSPSPPRFTALALVAGVLLPCAGLATAQPAGDRAGLEPVDQAVADLDPLARSQRRVEAGLRSDGEQTSLFVMPPRADGAPGQLPRYLRLGPGVQAEIPRGDYLVPINPIHNPAGVPLATNVAPLQDGLFMEMIPADTVFHLEPIDTRIGMPAPNATTPAADDPHDTGTPDARLDYRVDLRVDHRVHAAPIVQRIEPRRVE